MRQSWNESDILDSADILIQIIDEHLSRYGDKNPSRIFIGGFE